jgi:hypothetical protein
MNILIVESQMTGKADEAFKYQAQLERIVSNLKDKY